MTFSKQSKKRLLIEMGTFAANPIYRIMYSSEDLERFYFQYQSEALPHGEFLQSFCVKNKVPYNIFQKWFKDTRKKVVEVQVDGAPEIAHEEKTKTGDRPKPVLRSSNDNPVRIWIDIRISNGLHLSQKNLSYQDPQQCNIFLLQSFAILEINPLFCIRQLKSNRYGRDNCNSR